MRVTEARLMEIAQQGVGNARDRAAQAGGEVSTGVHVAVPSDDPVAWAEGARAASRQTMSTQRGDSIARSRDNLNEAERLYSDVGSWLSRAQQIAVQMSNGTLDASQRSAAAIEVQGLHDSALAAANRQGTDGNYLLGGELGTTAPFTAGGQFVGGTTERRINIAEGEQSSVTTTGKALTAASGVDVLGSFLALRDALNANDQTAVRISIGSLTSSVTQLADAQADVGYKMTALDDAEATRQTFEQNLAQTHARAVEADPITAAADFTRAKNALDAASAIAQQIVTLTQVH